MKPATRYLSIVTAAVVLHGCAANSPPAGGGNAPEALAARDASASVRPAAPTYLGERSVTSIFAGAKPGSVPGDKLLRVWHEPVRNVYLGLDPAAGWSDADVAAVWRALDRIENRFPHLYAAVFTGPKDGRTRALPYPANDPWTNRNRANAFIIVDKAYGSSRDRAIAANDYSLSPPGGNIFDNVPFIGLDPEVIDGRVPGVGPQLIYASRSAEAARAAYFDEGLTDTILHERIHGFISQFVGHDRLYGALRPSVPQPRCEYDLEELLLKKYLMAEYAKPNAGFSEEFTRYWAHDTSILQGKVVASECHGRLTQAGLLTSPLLRVP